MLRRLLALSWLHTAYDIDIAALVFLIAARYDQMEDQLLGWAMALALVFRRRRPMTVMALVVGLALVQQLVASDIAAYDLALLVAMVSVVAHTRTMWHA